MIGIKNIGLFANLLDYDNTQSKMQLLSCVFIIILLETSYSYIGPASLSSSSLNSLPRNKLFNQIIQNIKEETKIVSDCSKISKSSDQTLYFRKYLYKYYPSVLRNYNSDDSEVSYRQMVYRNNLVLIQQHNKKTNQTYSLSVNKFAMLTNQQFQEIYLSSFTSYSIKIQNRNAKNYISNRLQPKTTNDDNTLSERKAKDRCIDHRVFDQGQCGSCYAIASLDSIYVNLRLAEQFDKTFFSIKQILRCGSFNINGCNGGTIEGVFRYAKTRGILKQNQFFDTNCEVGQRFKIKGYKNYDDCYHLDRVLSYDWLVVAAYCNLKQQDRFYAQGIIFNSQYGQQTANHAVVVVHKVSYPNQHEKIYKIKNSWGAGWGMNGFGYFGSSTGICRFSYYSQEQI